MTVDARARANHEARVLDDLLAIVDWTGRVLIAAAPGSAYQLSKAYELRDRVNQLISRLELHGTLDQEQSAAVAADLRAEAVRFPLGEVLETRAMLGGGRA